jgi:outer membrane protein
MKLFAVLLLLGLLAGRTQAQLHFATLGEMLQWADKNSLVARQTSLQQGLSRQDEAINKGGLLPKVNVFGTADYFPIITSQVIPEALFGGSPDKFRTVQFGLPFSFSSGVELTIPVINFEKWEQLKRFRLQSQQTAWSSKTSIESLHIQLTQWYYQSLLTRELVKLNAGNQEVVNELLRILQQRKENAVLNPADHNRSRNLQLDIQSAGVEYEKNYNLSLLVLKQLLNLADTATLQLTDSITIADWQTVPQQNAITNRPAWKEAELRIAVAEQQLKESQKAAFPKIALSSRYTYQWQMKPSENQHINFDYASVGLRLDFPIFQGNFYRASAKKSEIQLQLAQANRQQTVNDLTRQQAEWWNNYHAAVKKNSLLQQKFDVATDNLRIAQLNMKEGIMEFEEFNNIFQEYNKARVDYLQNVNDGIVYRLLLTLKQ